MAIKKQLKDKDGNTIYPDVGLDLDSVVYSDDPEPVENPEPWVKSSDIVGGESLSTLASGATVEVVGTTTGNSANYAWKFADGRLINFQKYNASGNATNTWGPVYSGVQIVPRNYAVPFIATPIVVATPDHNNTNGNCWIATANEAGSASATKPGGYQVVRPTSMSGITTQVSVVAYGFWK